MPYFSVIISSGLSKLFSSSFTGNFIPRTKNNAWKIFAFNVVRLCFVSEEDGVSVFTFYFELRTVLCSWD